MDSDGIESFASQPLSNADVVYAEFADKKRTIESPEALNLPAAPVEGWEGGGFAEVDHGSDAGTEVEIPADGWYSVSVRYANGNGPVNTENRCAIRTLTIDGSPAGTIVMPQRGAGNWSDWGESNSVEVFLPAGRHSVGVVFLPENENMNLKVNHALLDKLVLRKLAR